MTEEELKKLAKEHHQGFDEIREIKDEMGKRFEWLNQEEFEIELNKQLEEMLEDARNDPIKTLKLKKQKMVP